MNKLGRVIGVTNSKGGVGKTAVSVNLAAALAELGHQVLLVDFDPQGSATIHFGIIDHLEISERTVYEALNGAPLDDIIIRTRCGVDLMPATIDLSSAEIDLVEKGLPEGATALRSVTSQLTSRYHYILLDSSPTFGILTLNVLVAADDVLIPVACDYLSLKALTQQLKLIEKVQSRYNSGLRVLGMLGTMYQGATNMSSVSLQMLRRAMDGRYRVFETVIRQAVAVKEASAAGEPLTSYFKLHPVAQAFRELAKEVGA